jgi:hypothetical protein
LYVCDKDESEVLHIDAFARHTSSRQTGSGMRGVRVLRPSKLRLKKKADPVKNPFYDDASDLFSYCHDGPNSVS